MTPEEFAKEVLDMIGHIHNRLVQIDDRLDDLERRVHGLPENVVLNHPDIKEDK